MGPKYVVTEALGHGSRVFRGLAVSSDATREVTITRVLPNGTRTRRFVPVLRHELRSTLRLQHPNIVEVLDIATTPDHVYFVITEYVEGCQLRAVARRERLPVAHALHVIVDCCRAVAHAHSRGIVHRDVSPRTLLLSTTGAAKLGSFGLARANAQIEPTDPGSARFGYLSPEAASGRPVDHRTDVFAIGVLLWELLAAGPLFHGQSDYQTIELVRAAHVPAIADLDPALDAIVRKALAREVDARFQRASELCDALVQYASSRGIRLAPVELGKLVRDVKFQLDYERAGSTHREGLARAREEVARMVSIVGDGPRGLVS